MSALPNLLAPRPQAAPTREQVGRELLLAMGLLYQSHAREHAVERVLDAREASPNLRAMVTALSRTAQEPAMTSVPEWAGALVATGTAVWWDLLAGQGSVIAKVPFHRVAFVRGIARSVVRRPLDEHTLTMSFRAEAEAIRVGRLSLLPASLTPKTAGVIASTTQEAINGAGDDALISIIKSGIATDSARGLDGLLFGVAPPTAVAPGGLGSYAVGANTRPSTGSDAASITADVRAALGQLVANGYGAPDTTRLVMSTLNAAWLTSLFPEVQMHNTLLRVPIVAGPFVGSDVVTLADFGAIAYGSDLPVIDSTIQALLHEEETGPASDLSTATPVRSLWQTRCAAVRGTMAVNWQPAEGAVQTITAVDWTSPPAP